MGHTVQGLAWETKRGVIGAKWESWKQDVSRVGWSEHQAAHTVLHIAADLFTKAELLRKVLPGVPWAALGPHTHFVNAMVNMDELADRVVLLRQVRALPVEAEDGILSPAWFTWKRVKVGDAVGAEATLAQGFCYNSL